MSTTFPSPRWRGRLVGTLFLLASRHDIIPDSEESLTLRDFIDTVLPCATDDEQQTIHSLIRRFDDACAAEQAAGVSFTVEEEESLGKLGREEVKACLEHYGHLHNIGSDEDFTATAASLQRKRRRNTLMGYLCMGIPLVLLTAAFALKSPFISETALYAETMYKRTPALIQEYKDRYPQGCYIEKVYRIGVEESPDPLNQIHTYMEHFPKAKHIEDLYRFQAEKTGYSPEIMEDYILRFPEGKYTDAFSLKLDSVHDCLSKAFLGAVHHRISPEAETYLTALLKYMKQDGYYTLYVEPWPELDLKDLDEFPAQSVHQLDRLLAAKSGMPLQAHILPFRGQFSIEDCNNLDQVLSDQIARCFSKHSGPGLAVVGVEKTMAPEHSPVVRIHYTVKNRMMPQQQSLPDIWVYQKDNAFQSYLLGFTLHIKAEFIIPGSGTRFSLEETCHPENEIGRIASTDNGYYAITRNCFEKFGDTVHKALTGRPAAH